MLQEPFSLRLGIVGAGRAAWAFGSLWRAAGWPLAGITLRPGSEKRVATELRAPLLSSEELIEAADLVLVAVPDRELEEVARFWIPAVKRRASALFHPSGIASSDVFAPALLRFSLHPLRALPSPGLHDALAGAFFAFEGSSGTEEIASAIVAAANGRMAVIPKESKATYHAAAVFASNYVAVLCDVARELLRTTAPGTVTEGDIADLARSAIENWAAAAPGAEFTGPASRGDAATVEAHLRALAAHPEARTVYLALARELVTRASGRTAHRNDLEALRRWLDAMPFP